MSNAAPDPVGAKGVAATERKGDFFSMFYLPSSQSYDEDVHLTASSYSPFQGAASAASAVVGGILSVLDTAMAVMNDEFDNPSDSIISDSTKEEDDDSSVMRCCRKSARPSTSARRDIVRALTANKDKVADNPEQSENYENNAHDRAIEQSDSQEKDYFTPQNSLIGSISTLQLYEEGNSEIAKPLISQLHSKLIHDKKMNKKSENHCKDLMCSESEISKNEDSEYCIIKDERETKDGWLVVSDD